MTEPTILCPNCKTEIKLTESLAAPLVESTRKQFEQRVAKIETEVARREMAVKNQEAALARATESLEEQVAARVKNERAAIAAAEAKKARDTFADDMEKLRLEKSAAEELVKDRNAKLLELQKNELALRKDRQRLQEEMDQFELDKQKAIDAERAKIRESARKDADDQAQLKIAEKDKTILDLSGKLEDALRKAQQGSQQLQGEVLELQLEGILRERFPRDCIEPVPKGEHGGDVLHRVRGPFDRDCGTILWEAKRTKNWSDDWLSKLREDARTAHAEIAIVASQVLPKGTESFGQIDGVWVTSFKYAIPVAVALRHVLIEVTAARTAGEGQLTKMETVYQYLTGPRFRHRVEGILEKLTEMREDLDKERKTMTRLWAKREEQIQGALGAACGMYGDLQGIAGKSLAEIEGMEVKLLE